MKNVKNFQFLYVILIFDIYIFNFLSSTYYSLYYVMILNIQLVKYYENIFTQHFNR
jgi:hypothetical protein